MWHTRRNFRPHHFLKSVYFCHDAFRTPTVMSRQYAHSTASAVLRLSYLPVRVRLWLLCTSGSKGKIVALFHLPIYYRYANTNDSLQAFLLKIFIIQKLLNDVLLPAYRRKQRAGELMCRCCTDTLCRQNNSARG